MLSVRTAIAIVLLHQCLFAQKRTLTLWMMPLEPAIDEGQQWRDIGPEIDRFNAKWPNVVVLNTHDPLRQILILRNVELAAPNWSWVRGQAKTLDALERFAKLNDDLQIRVRFLTWSEAFEELLNINRLLSRDRPDLVQIGSTWERYFTENGRISTSVRFINDLRLLFYWTRFPWQPASKAPWRLHAGSWNSVLDSLKAAPSGSLVFPIGLTSNLLHDYIPLVRAGGAPLVKPLAIFGNGLDLTSKPAMQVPLLLANGACGDSPCTWQGRSMIAPRRLIAFIDADHEEIAQRFILGDFLAIIEPLHFIRRWHTAFVNESNRHGTARVFRDHAGVAIPPFAFLGGSSLGIVTGTAQQDIARALARFLTTDRAFTWSLAEYGHLPEGLPDHGAVILMETLGADGIGIPLEEIVNSVFTQRPHLPEEIGKWTIEMESRGTLEALQQVWRRMGDPVAEASLISSAAAEAERSVNIQINPTFRYWNNFKDAGYVFAVVFALGSVICFGIVALFMRVTYAYFRILAKHWGRAIAGPIAALSGLIFSLIVRLSPSATKYVNWVSLFVATLLIFWAQYKAWQELFGMYDERRERQRRDKTYC